MRVADMLAKKEKSGPKLVSNIIARKSAPVTTHGPVLNDANRRVVLGSFRYLFSYLDRLVI